MIRHLLISIDTKDHVMLVLNIAVLKRSCTAALCTAGICTYSGISKGDRLYEAPDKRYRLIHYLPPNGPKGFKMLFKVYFKMLSIELKSVDMTAVKYSVHKSRFY